MTHRDVIRDKDNLCFISAVSVWEIFIKRGLGKLKIPLQFIRTMKDQGFQELPMTWKHSQKIEDLPLLHKDPFDRMLIAQALCEELTLLTSNEDIKKYNVKFL